MKGWVMWVRGCGERVGEVGERVGEGEERVDEKVGQKVRGGG